MNTPREQLIESIIPKMKRAVRVDKRISTTFNLPQIQALFYLSKEADGISMKELADKLCVTGGAVTQVIDSLIDQKLLIRKHDDTDRRSVKVKLSKEGEVRFKTFKKEYFQAVMPRFDHLTDEELETLVRLLDKITIT